MCGSALLLWWKGVHASVSYTNRESTLMSREYGPRGPSWWRPYSATFHATRLPV
jgi:hypothetical protein